MSRAPRRRWLLAMVLLTVCMPVLGGPATGFDPVYDLLNDRCGSCHVEGRANGPWSLNTPPSDTRFPQCRGLPGDGPLRCATYHELVDAPAPGIPAWIRPGEATGSEPYAEACDPAVSFHIGASLPSALPAEDCVLLLDWIEAGAPR